MEFVSRHPAISARNGCTYDDVVRRARPVHFELDDEVYRYGGNGTSLVAVMDDAWMLLTADHVLKNAAVRSIFVLPTDRSRRRLRFERRVRVTSRIDGDTDLADVACLKIDTSDLSIPVGDELLGINLRFPTASPARGDELIVAGYPGASRAVDYERRGIIAIGQVVSARYLGAGMGARCHEIEFTELGELADRDGLSGSPVYSIGDRDGDLVIIRLAGMLLRGNAASRRGHYVAASVLSAAAETASTGRPTVLVRRGTRPQHAS